MEELQIKSWTTICDWMNFVREVCSTDLINTHEPLTGDIIEIDQSNFRKKARGNIGNAFVVHNKWVFWWDFKNEQKNIFEIC